MKPCQACRDDQLTCDGSCHTSGCMHGCDGLCHGDHVPTPPPTPADVDGETYKRCRTCNGLRWVGQFGTPPKECPTCDGQGYVPMRAAEPPPTPADVEALAGRLVEALNAAGLYVTSKPTDHRALVNKCVPVLARALVAEKLVTLDTWADCHAKLAEARAKHRTLQDKVRELVEADDVFDKSVLERRDSDSARDCQRYTAAVEALREALEKGE